MDRTITITMTRDDMRDLLEGTGSGDHALRRAVVQAQAGEPLANLLVGEWADSWPVVDRYMVLTGESRDSGCDGWYNVDDEAAILCDEARDGGWHIDDEDGYACPPETLECTTFDGQDVILTAGMTDASTGQQLFGMFASEADARSLMADSLAIGTVGRSRLTPEQVALAQRNSDAL